MLAAMGKARSRMPSSYRRGVAYAHIAPLLPYRPRAHEPRSAEGHAPMIHRSQRFLEWDDRPRLSGHGEAQLDRTGGGPPQAARGRPPAAPPPEGNRPNGPGPRGAGPPPPPGTPPRRGGCPPPAPPVPAGYGYGQPGVAVVPPGMYFDPASGLALPQGVQLASSGRRIGAFFLAIPLAIVTLGIGYAIWGLIVWANGQTPALQVLGMRCWRPEDGRVHGSWWMG